MTLWQANHDTKAVILNGLLRMSQEFIFEYCSLKDYKREIGFLDRSHTIPGTRKLHLFIPSARKIYFFSAMIVTVKDSETEVAVQVGLCYMCSWWRVVIWVSFMWMRIMKMWRWILLARPHHSSIFQTRYSHNFSLCCFDKSYPRRYSGQTYNLFQKES